MLKHRNYNIINDFIVKIPNNHPYNKPSLNSIKVTLSNNSVAQNTKLLIPLINLSLSLLGQFPLIVEAKKSVASFKLRKDSPVGLITTLRSYNSEKFLNLLNYYFLPRVTPNKSFNLPASPTGRKAEGELSWQAEAGCPEGKPGLVNTQGFKTLSFGFNSTVVLSYLTPLDESLFMHLTNSSASQELLSNKTGGYIQITHHYIPPTMAEQQGVGSLARSPKETNHHHISHKFFFSLLYIPLTYKP